MPLLLALFNLGSGKSTVFTGALAKDDSVHTSAGKLVYLGD